MAEYCLATITIISDRQLDDDDMCEEVLENTKGIDVCYAHERGFCVRKTPENIKANKIIANKRGMKVINVQSACDLRFSHTDKKTWTLRMKDNMPWKRSDLQQLLDAFSEIGIKASLNIKETCTFTCTTELDVDLLKDLTSGDRVVTAYSNRFDPHNGMRYST